MGRTAFAGLPGSIWVRVLRTPQSREGRGHGGRAGHFVMGSLKRRGGLNIGFREDGSTVYCSLYWGVHGGGTGRYRIESFTKSFTRGSYFYWS